MTEPAEFDGVPALTWRQELRLHFTRRAEGLPPMQGQAVTDLVLDGGHTPYEHIDRLILDAFSAWQRDRGEGVWDW